MNLTKIKNLVTFGQFWGQLIVEFWPNEAILAIFMAIVEAKRAKTGGDDLYFQFLHVLNSI